MDLGDLGLIPEIPAKTLVGGGGRKVAFASRKLQLKGSRECLGDSGVELSCVPLLQDGQLGGNSAFKLFTLTADNCSPLCLSFPSSDLLCSPGRDWWEALDEHWSL